METTNGSDWRAVTEARLVELDATLKPLLNERSRLRHALGLQRDPGKSYVGKHRRVLEEFFADGKPHHFGTAEARRLGIKNSSTTGLAYGIGCVRVGLATYQLKAKS